MRFIYFLNNKKKIIELIINLLISFGIFCYDFGGVPTGDWIGLNIIPLFAGLLAWLVFEIGGFLLNINKVNYYISLLMSISLSIIFIYILKKM